MLHSGKTYKNTIFFLKSKKSLKKSNCSKFFGKNKIWFFGQIFHRKCLLTSSKGTRNNQEKILIRFWNISKKHGFFDQKWYVRPSVNIKLLFLGGKNFQNIKPKDIQRGPLGDHLKDDPASGDKKHFGLSRVPYRFSLLNFLCFDSAFITLFLKI